MNMRWFTKKKREEEGDERIISKFLIQPWTFNGETKWLERAKIKQRYTCFKKPIFGTGTATEITCCEWKYVGWA